MRDLTLSANSMLKFDVGVIGEPMPTMQWTVGGQPLRYCHLSFQIQIKLSFSLTSFNRFLYALLCSL